MICPTLQAIEFPLWLAKRDTLLAHCLTLKAGIDRLIGLWAASQTLAFPNLIVGGNLAHNSHTSLMWPSMTNRVKVKIFHLPDTRLSIRT
jgi:hypothetical protein